MIPTKFRVFFYDGEDCSTGVMLTAEEAFQEDLIEFIGYELKPTDKCSIMLQFAGLFDKNGKEIYENDLIRFENEDGNVNVYQVIFQEEHEDETQHYMSGFTGKFIKDITDEIYDENGHCPKDWDGGIEVVGNIYENPELLERPK